MNIFKLTGFIGVALLLGACGENGTGKKKTSTGYEYEVVSKGEGQKVNVGDYVFFSLLIKGDEGSVFQENFNPDELPAIQIPELDAPDRSDNPIFEVFDNSAIGDSIIFYMPVDSLKGGAPNQMVKMITYEMKVMKVMDQAAYDAFREELQQKQMAVQVELQAKLPEIESLVKSTIDAYKANSLTGVQSTESGLKYVIHEEGTGEMVKSGDNVSVQYYGVLESDGTMFDNSFNRGQAFNFNVGQGSVIKGWDEGLPLMKEGGKATLFIPSDLGYGASGTPGIPPASNLVFYVEVEKIN